MPTGHKPSYSIISKENPPRPPIRRRTGRQRPMRSRIVERPRPDLRSTANGRSLPSNRRRLLPMREIAIAPIAAFDEEGTIRENGNHLAETQEAGEPPDAFSPVRSGRARLVRSPARIRSLYPTAKDCGGIRGRKDALYRCVAPAPASRFFPNDAFPCGCGSIERYRQLLRCDVYFAVFLRSKGIPYRATLGLGPIHPIAKNLRSIRGRMPRADPSIAPRIPGRGTSGDRGRHLEAMVGNQRSAPGVRKTRPPISRFSPLKILSGREYLRERTFQHFRRSRSSAGRMKTPAAETSGTESVAGSVRVCAAPSAFFLPVVPPTFSGDSIAPENDFTPAAMFCSRGESHFRALSQQPFSYRPIRLRVL